MRARGIAAAAFLASALCACSAGKSNVEGGADNAGGGAAVTEPAVILAEPASLADAPASNDSFATAGSKGAASSAPTGGGAGGFSTPASAEASAPPQPAAAAQGPARGLVVNGVELDAQMRAALAQAYGAVPDGKYWYDPMSGLVGVAGGPSSGQILPNLPFGTLAADASGGGDGTLTGLFINGREIHPDEAKLLMAMFGYVNPGRYWLGPNFVGGYEGGPAMFDLRASARGAGQGGEPGYNRSTLFGDLMSDGQCSGYFDPNSGSSVMTGNC